MRKVEYIARSVYARRGRNRRYANATDDSGRLLGETSEREGESAVGMADSHGRGSAGTLYILPLAGSKKPR